MVGHKSRLLWENGCCNFLFSLFWLYHWVDQHFKKLSESKFKKYLYLTKYWLIFKFEKYPQHKPSWTDYGAIFLCRFRLYMLSFMFRFMFSNICFEKNQNSKIHVMFIINITWNETWNNQVLPFGLFHLHSR